MSYTIIVSFTGVKADTPQEAAKQIADYLQNYAQDCLYDVEDEKGNTTVIDLNDDNNQH